MRQPKSFCLTRRSTAVNALYSGGMCIRDTETPYHSRFRSSTLWSAFIARADTRGLNGCGKSVVGASGTVGTEFLFDVTGSQGRVTSTACHKVSHCALWEIHKCDAKPK